MTTKEVNDRNWTVPFWIGVTLVSCAMNVVFLEKLVRQVMLFGSGRIFLYLFFGDYILMV